MNVADILGSQVTRLRVNTAYLPPIDIQNPLQRQPDAQDSGILQTLKPQVILTVDGEDFYINPYGDPGPPAWPWIEAGLGFFALSYIFLGYKYFSHKKQIKRLRAA